MTGKGKDKLTLKGSTIVKIKLDKEYSHLMADFQEDFQKGTLEPPGALVTMLIDQRDAVMLGLSKNREGAFDEKGFDGRELPLTVLAHLANEQGVIEFCQSIFQERYYALENSLNEFVTLGGSLLDDKGIPCSLGSDAGDLSPIVHPRMMDAIKTCQDVLQNAQFINGLDSMEKGDISSLDCADDSPNRPRPRRRTTSHLRAVDPIDCGDKK